MGQTLDKLRCICTYTSSELFILMNASNAIRDRRLSFECPWGGGGGDGEGSWGLSTSRGCFRCSKCFRILKTSFICVLYMIPSSLFYSRGGGVDDEEKVRSLHSPRPHLFDRLADSPQIFSHELGKKIKDVLLTPPPPPPLPPNGIGRRNFTFPGAKKKENSSAHYPPSPSSLNEISVGMIF